MSLESDVTGVLRRSTTQRINFQCPPSRVYGRGYRTIADAIESGRIHLAGYTLATEQRLCVYQSDLGPNHVNRMLISSALDFGNPFEVQLVVHEATHALQDYHATPMNQIDAEAAAYIAGFFYTVACGKTVADLDAFMAASDMQQAFRNISINAFGIASRIFNTEGAYEVYQPEIDLLKQAITGVPAYRAQRETTWEFDGLRSTG